MNTVKPANRRDFLKGTTVAAAGLALAGGLDLSRAAHAAGSDELKIALVGCGGRGGGAVSDCLSSCENVKLIAVADAFAENAKTKLAELRAEEDIAKKIDVPKDRVFIGFDAYEKAIAAGPDIVLLATPPGFRPIHYAAAIAAGKHVFMEKPCCTDAPGFRSLMETNKLVDEKGLKVVVGLQRRHSREFLGKVKRIQDGLLGKVMFTRAYWNGGPIWVRERKPEQTEMEYQMRNWYHFVWLCGDHILEQHVHNIDISNWVKQDHPIMANGMGSCHCRRHPTLENSKIGQIYDNHTVEFTYKDGTKLFSQCRQQPNVWNNVTQYVHGTKGAMELPGGGGDGYKREHVHLVDAIRNGKKLNDGWHGATSSFTALLGRMATYSGQEVFWDEAAAKGPGEMPAKFAFDADPPVMPDKNGDYPQPIPGIYKPY